MDITLANKKQAWLHAIRLRTLPLALSSILMGSFLAAYNQSFRWDVFLLAALTTVFLQILSNLANDYGDSVHGADSQKRQGPIRAVQSGVISLAEMKKAMILLSSLSLTSGLVLLYIALQDWKLFALFLALGILAIIAAITYTSGKKPYGYAGLGDLSVFIFFGLLGVSGTYFLHALTFDWVILLPAVSLGLFSTAVLNINNIRDIESDSMAGKKSIPVRIGKKAALIYNWILILGGNISIIIFAFSGNQFWALAPILISPLMIKVGFGVSEGKDARAIDPFLKKMAISTLLWVIVFGSAWFIFN
ncbi:1,4-dihydroxy-2-naphthoate polyprenyltransferase [Belliella pelovolcani]|uniref:1,4-dihydroxy-2-naphthoate polyprenyltransferase n=1 Tax=Belliella pelovolcani TaxID=529505 RepID=UPI00391AE195